jgi:hypothetical protein
VRSRGRSAWPRAASTAAPRRLDVRAARLFDGRVRQGSTHFLQRPPP